jgi:CBS domain-containing protein
MAARSTRTHDPAAEVDDARAAGVRVGDVMTPDPLVFDEDLPLRTAALLLFHADISGAPVVARSGALLGVLSEADLLTKEAGERRPALGRRARTAQRRRTARTAGEACTRPARTTSPRTPVADAARRMLQEEVSRLVVVDAGRLVGIITRHDVLEALLRDDADIEASVRRIIAEAGEEEVEATVEWGEVHLRGVASTLRAAALLIEAVHAVDGTMGIDTTALGHREDDLLPVIPLM